MWKFRRIGDYYELLDGAETLYLCKRLDSIMVATLEDLCNRHNAEMAKYENLDIDIVSCDEAYLTGLEDGKEDGKEEGYQNGYDTGFNDGYEYGKSDGYDIGYIQALHDAMGHDVVMMQWAMM